MIKIPCQGKNELDQTSIEKKKRSLRCCASFLIYPYSYKAETKYIYLNEKVSHEYEIVVRPVVCLCTHVRESKGKGGRLHLLGIQQCMWVNL